MCIFELYFLFRLHIKIELFVWFSLVHCEVIPKSNIPICSCRNHFFIDQFYILNISIMTGSIFINANHRFDQISLPQQQFSILRRTDDISIFKLSKWCYIWQLKLTEFSNVSFKFQSCEGRSNFPKPNMACSTRCYPFFVELAKVDSINFLTKGFRFEHNLLLFPLPHCQQKIGTWANRS